MIIDSINQFVIDLINGTGYIGIFLAMLVEGVFTPIPSEMIMPFAGYVAYTGELNYFLVILVGSLGAVVGSFIAFLLAWHLGRPIINKLGPYIGLDQKKLETAEHWFKKWGGLGHIHRALPPRHPINNILPRRAGQDGPFEVHHLHLLRGAGLEHRAGYCGILTRRELDAVLEEHRRVGLHTARCSGHSIGGLLPLLPTQEG
ncbi:MAG: DedA family protein [Methanomassiliicoccales archaeon]|nr:DedA family protein [Methanomassiliicoccales archaeon]